MELLGYGAPQIWRLRDGLDLRKGWMDSETGRYYLFWQGPDWRPLGHLNGRNEGYQGGKDGDDHTKEAAPNEP